MEFEIGMDSLSKNLDNVEFARPLGDLQNRRVYLITYLRAIFGKIPDCQAFSKCVLEAFDEGKSNKKVVERACCRDDNADGGKYYLMAVSLNGTRRLSNFDVAQFIVANNVKTKSELMRLALRRSENGDNDLHALILNRTHKALADLQDGSRRMVQDTPKVAESK